MFLLTRIIRYTKMMGKSYMKLLKILGDNLFKSSQKKFYY